VFVHNEPVNRWVKRILIAVPVLVALFFGAILLYAEVLNDSPGALDENDLSAVVAGADTTEPDSTTGATASEASTATVVADTATTAATGTAPRAVVDGTWTVTDESEFGYRVEEVLFGVNATAAGRSNQITGSMTIEGTTVTAASFTVDVGSITSDESRRDNQFRGRIMSVDQFPEATFTLTAPVDFGTVPAPSEQITATATGDLTLRGVTRPVTFDVTAEADDDRIGVLGSIPVQFADFDIPNPSIAGITTEDNGVLEFILVFERA
jgi:polyisoprenoid-binding protein YceI